MLFFAATSWRTSRLTLELKLYKLGKADLARTYLVPSARATRDIRATQYGFCDAVSGCQGICIVNNLLKHTHCVRKTSST